MELPKSLARIGITCGDEALLVAPCAYRDLSSPLLVLPVPEEGVPIFVRTLLTSLAFYSRIGEQVEPHDRSASRAMATVADELGDEARVIAFQNLAAWKELQPGQEVHLVGELTLWHGSRQFHNPVLCKPEDVGRIHAIYSGRAGLTSAEAVREGVDAARDCVRGAAELLLQRTRQERDEFRCRWRMEPEELFNALHWPLDMQQATRALDTARQVSLASVTAQVRASRERVANERSAITISLDVLKDLVARLPLQLTRDQRRAIWDIVQDLQAPYAMARMLSGDVGTGKSATFMVPAVAAYKAGASVAILAPTKPLVEQLVSELKSYFPEVAVSPVVSGLKLPDRGIVVGTTALTIAASAKQAVYDFVIIDEQHKFSVAQRTALKAPHSNSLESTATAIPRTVALLGMGGMDVSVLMESPVKKNVRTSLVPKHKGRDMFGFIKERIRAGAQVAVIYPLVESDKTGRTVESAVERFATHFGDRVGIIHGRQKAEQKQRTLERMRNRELDVLISTTVIEVGLTLPDLRVVVVVNPDRFGASQLHQLRGRLARTGGDGYFFMFLLENQRPKPETMDRLRLLVNCTNGFDLAVKDAELRGAGEVFADLGAQSGSTRSLFFGIDLTYGDLERATLAALAGDNARQQAPVAHRDTAAIGG